MRQLRYTIVVVASLVLAASFQSAVRADYVYDINAAVGEGGTTLSGTVTFIGSAGAPATIDPSFDDIASFDIFWNYGPGSVEWNPSDVDSNSYSTGVFFDNPLGAPVLTPIDGYVYLETISSGSAVGLYLGNNGIVPAWQVSLASGEGEGEPLDFGSPVNLVLPSVAATPLPSPFSMALAGLPALVVGRWVKSRRQVA